MKTYKEVTYPEHTKTVVDKTLCDLCNKEIEQDWTNFSVDECIVQLKEGEVYPEGGSWEEINYDVCNKCFEEKLVPWMESQGVRTIKEEKNI